MKATFLGTGTSVGIPMIGCRCRVCTSPDARNRRRRSSLYVHAAGTHVVIDTSLDFREQVLACQVPRVDAVLITHSHADHIFGLDDLRRYNTLQGMSIPVYAGPATIRDLRRIFNYVNEEPSPPGVYRPQLDFTPVEGAFQAAGIRVEPLPVEHGSAETCGFLLEADGHRLGYFPDCHAMPPATLARLQGVDVMVLDGLRHRPHLTHLTVAAAVDLLATIGAGQAYLTHLCHDLDHEETAKGLPAGIGVAYDGLTVEW